MLVNIFDIESLDEYGRTPLSLALIVDKIAPAKKLIELGANVNHGGADSPLSITRLKKSLFVMVAALVIKISKKT